MEVIKSIKIPRIKRNKLKESDYYYLEYRSHDVYRPGQFFDPGVSGVLIHLAWKKKGGDTQVISVHKNEAIFRPYEFIESGETYFDPVGGFTIKTISVDLEKAQVEINFNPDAAQFPHVEEDNSLFVRGDSNGDEGVDLSDAVYTLGYLFQGRSEPYCLDAADANDDGRVDISDAIFTLNFLFLGEESGKLPIPYPDADIDPTEDDFNCGSI